MSLRTCTLACLAALGAATASAQEWIAGIGFRTFFDNREYSGMGFDGSKTFFAARLTPEAGLRWAECNRLMTAVDLMQDFGDGSTFLTEAKPQIWYQYETPRVLAAAGIFSRTKLRGDYGEAFFDRAYAFYNNRLQGVMGQYRSEGGGFVELAIDWEGMQSAERRERFRLLSAGELHGHRFYGGYALSVLHFAKTSAPAADEGIVDHILVNPYAGLRFSAFFDFDIRLGYLQSLQRDRIAEGGWEAPKGGVLDIRFSRWGLSLGNMLYAGENQMPFYDRYGGALYSGCAFFGTRDHIYNRTDLSYGNSFFGGTLDIRAGILFHYDGVGLGTQQVLTLSVKLEKIFGRQAK